MQAQRYFTIVHRRRQIPLPQGKYATTLPQNHRIVRFRRLGDGLGLSSRLLLRVCTGRGTLPG
jgi:hypothetical protein